MDDSARFSWQGFQAATAQWFERTLGAPTPAQTDAWPHIQAGRDVLVAAPTGSGKTLAAFLAVIDNLVEEAGQGPLPVETRVLYVSPLKALSNDIRKNLQSPLSGIEDALLEQGRPPAQITAMVRTGDTSQRERDQMRRQPPHILVTTPESLFILLGSESGRAMLSTVRSVIVDEIHAVASNKRGAHLSLSLARLRALSGGQIQHIGLSATQKPIDSVARFLSGEQPCQIIDSGHSRQRDLALELPGSPLSAVMAAEVWGEVYSRIAELAQAHRTTLVFVNTRRLAERASRHLADQLGEELVAAHHGSMSKEHRLDAEQRLKSGSLRVLVATASLELGIDIGEVDLVCQIGSPGGINAFLQRVGRSGHAVGATPKGRLFPTTLDEAVECAALLAAVERGELDVLNQADAALDVLAQHLVAEVAAREWEQGALLQLVRSSWPYHALTPARFEDVIRMLSEGYSSRRGRRGAYIHWDQVNGMLRGRRGARLVALTNAGVIPDQFDYDVVLMPQGFKVGTLNEDFAFETLAGDIFQLGNQSYKVLKTESGRVLVEDAHGQPPTVPFWLGERPGRSDALSSAVSAFRREVSEHYQQGEDAALNQLMQAYGLTADAASQLVQYLAAGEAALGAMPNHDTIVLERFFDETGDMHLVVHSTYGSRINKAWGLALRKRFCRKFNFELQAAALEDSIVLSLGVTHSFPLAEVASYLKPESVRSVLEQALLDAPMFPTHWRWNASIALAIRRHLGHRKTPPAWQRNDAEDLMAVVFPDQIACAENLSGKRDIPDHPLVSQTINDCLFELMDLPGLEKVLRGLGDGSIALVCADLTAPSPLAQEILNARPFAFLDDGDAEARRTMAVAQGAALPVEDARALARLDAQAIARVREEAWPSPRDADELHDALIIHGGFSDDEVKPWAPWLEPLMAQGRAARAVLPQGGALWVAAERWPQLHAVVPDARCEPQLKQLSISPDADPLRELVRGRLEACGPTNAAQIAGLLGQPESAIDQALIALENEGFALRGQFDPALDDSREQWCERRLLARIHRHSRDRKRSSIRPVSAQVFQRFVLHWQGIGDERPEGLDAILAAMEKLEGYSAPAQVWEQHILPARIALYLPAQLDSLCAAGKLTWARIVAKSSGAKGRGPVRNTPIAFAPRETLACWMPANSPQLELSANAARVLAALEQRGAAFFSDLAQCTGLLRAQLEQALGELVAAGQINADTFAGLRSLITPSKTKPRSAPRTRRRQPLFSGAQDAGRWSLLQATQPPDDDEVIEHILWTTLMRYGVISRSLLEREAVRPAWRRMLQRAWRLEARGEIAGGRFIDGMAGEQFALPEAVEMLRSMNTRPASGEMLRLSACDPAHLSGRVLAGPKITEQASNLVVYRDGELLGWMQRGSPETVRDLSESDRLKVLATLTGNSQFGQRGLPHRHSS